MGYATHRWLAMGHLAEAEAETLVDYPDLALQINEERKNIEIDLAYDPKLMEIIEAATAIEQAEAKKKKRKKK
jgi:hypothetical protein